MYQYWFHSAVAGARWREHGKKQFDALLKAAELEPLIRELLETNRKAIRRLAALRHDAGRLGSGAYVTWLRDFAGKLAEILEENNSVLGETLQSSAASFLGAQIFRTERASCPAAELERLLIDLSTGGHAGFRETAERLQRRLLEIDGEEIASCATPPSAEAKFHLNFLVLLVHQVDVVEQEFPLPDMVWTRLSQFANRLGICPKGKVVLYRPTQAGDDVDIVYDSPIKPQRIVRTGIWLDIDGRRSECVRAQLSLPIPVPPSYSCLWAMERACSPEAVRAAAGQLRRLLEKPPGASSLCQVFQRAKDHEAAILKESVAALLAHVHLLMALPTEARSDAQLDNDLRLFERFQRELESEGIRGRLATAAELKDRWRWRLCCDSGTVGISTLVIEGPPGIATPPEVLASIPPRDENPLAASLFDQSTRWSLPQSQDPDWQGWRDLDVLRMQVCQPPAPSPRRPAEQRMLAWKIFTMFVARSFEQPQRREIYRSLAGNFFACFSTLGGRSPLPWDAERNELSPLSSDFINKCEIFWEADASPPGSIMRINRFGSDTEMPSLVVSCGADQEWCLGWLQLAPPDFVERTHILWEIHAGISRLPFQEVVPEKWNDAIIERFVSYCGNEGHSWLNEWAHRLLSPAASENELAWFQQLRGAKLRLYPEIDPRRRTVSWPAGTATLNRDIVFAPSDEPVDRVLDRPPWARTIFSVVPKRCAVRLSQGTSPDSLLAAANRALVVCLTELADQHVALRIKLGILLTSLRDHDRGLPVANLGAEFLSPLHALLEIAANCSDRSELSRFDRVLRAIEDVAARFEVEITPSTWSWSACPAWKAEWGEPNAFFSPHVERGQLALQAFGVRFQRQELHACRDSWSAGPAPTGFTRLQEMLGDLRRQAQIPALSAILTRLEQLPRHCFQDGQSPELWNQAVIGEVVEVFQAWYDEARPRLEANGTPIDGQVSELLQHLARHFGLETFPGKEPFMSDLDPRVDEWFDYLDCGVPLSESSKRQGNTTKRGCIERTLRPGLRRVGQPRPEVKARVTLKTITNFAR